MSAIFYNSDPVLMYVSITNFTELNAIIATIMFSKILEELNATAAFLTMFSGKKMNKEESSVSNFCYYKSD